MVNGISVIIPVYNHETCISKCVESVIQQDYKGELEIIIVNDGSSDGSLLKIYDLKKLYSEFRIKVINQSNIGVSAARNVGMKNSKLDYIALLDADDSWHSDKLTIQMNLMIENDIDFSGSILSIKPLKNYLFSRAGDLINIKLYHLLFKFCFQPSTVLFKREIIETVGFFDENMRFAEEGNYFMRIVHYGYKCVLINQKLSRFGDDLKKSFGESGLSGNLKKMQKGEIQNHKYAYNNLGVPFYIYFFARVVSEIKYLRRMLIVALR